MNPEERSKTDAKSAPAALAGRLLTACLLAATLLAASCATGSQEGMKTAEVATRQEPSAQGVAAPQRHDGDTVSEIMGTNGATADARRAIRRGFRIAGIA